MSSGKNQCDLKTWLNLTQFSKISFHFNSQQESSCLIDDFKVHAENITTRFKNRRGSRTLMQTTEKSRSENFILNAISVSQFSHQVLVKNSFEKKIYVSWIASTFYIFSSDNWNCFTFFSPFFFSHPLNVMYMNSFSLLPRIRLKCHHYKKYIITASKKNTFSRLPWNSFRILPRLRRLHDKRQMSC